MERQAVPIKDVLSAVISKMSGEKKAKIDYIKQAWAEVVDKNIYSHTRLAGFKTKRLIINVDSSAWMYELNLHKDELKTRLNGEFRDKKGIIINEIVLRIGEVG